MTSRWTPVVIVLALAAGTLGLATGQQVLRVDSTAELEPASPPHGPRVSKRLEAPDRDHRDAAQHNSPALPSRHVDGPTNWRVGVVGSRRASLAYEGVGTSFARARAPPVT